MPKAIATVPGEFRVVRYDVRSFYGDYRCMDYGDPTSDRMSQLRREFDLEEVVSGAGSEFEGFLALKRWVRSRWNHGYSHVRVDVKDSLDILRAAANGEQFCCGHYARTFVDCACALGWPARTIGITIEHPEYPRDYHVGNTGHSIVEVWSNEYEKWVVMDPDVNVYYCRDGVPLCALEIRDAWLAGEAEEVEMVQDEPAFVVPSGDTLVLLRQEGMYSAWTDEVVKQVFARFGRNRVMDYYARLSINGWEWVDEKVLPTFVNHYGARNVKPTSNPADIYWSLNMVRLSAQPSWDENGSRLKITLEHCMPNFDHYEVRLNDAPWEKVSDSFDWPMMEGVNALECRAVNVMGRPGIVSRFDVAHSRFIDFGGRKG